MSRRLRVLLYGGDARTEALAEACAASGESPELFAYAALEHPGLLERCGDDRVTVGSLTDVPGMVAAARQVEPDLAIVGPEAPLVAGLVDALTEIGVACFGPAAAPARVEGSKRWTRQLLEEHRIAGNPRFHVFERADGLDDYLDELGAFVVKPDGLTGGKGVKVFGEHLSTRAEARDYALALIEADGCVLVEERLDGEEFSLQTITDGAAVVHSPPVQDHKRAYDGDAGPNTGGMGSYSCADHSLPFLDAKDLAKARAVNEAVVAALGAATGADYRGVLYGGFMATADGIRVIEYNARFGDPEAMNVVPLLDGDFVALARAVATGTLGDLAVGFAPRASVCKYVVPASYPGPGGDGDVIEAPASQSSDLRRYWAATRRRDGRTALTGSRAVAFVGFGATLAEAEARAEAGASSVQGAVRHRSDIGTATLVDSRVDHMRALRGK